MTGQEYVVAALKAAGGELTHKQLVDALHTSGQHSVAANLRRLPKQGYTSRVDATKSRPVLMYRLEKGV